MSEAFDIVSLGPGWKPALPTDHLVGCKVALRIPTEVGTRTVIGEFVLIGDGKVLVCLGRVRREYSVHCIVAKKAVYDLTAARYFG